MSFKLDRDLSSPSLSEASSMTDRDGTPTPVRMDDTLEEKVDKVASDTFVFIPLPLPLSKNILLSKPLFSPPPAPKITPKRSWESEKVDVKRRK